MGASLHRLIKVGKLLAQVGDLRQIIGDDVWVVGMMNGVILMVSLGFVKSFQGNHLGDGREYDICANFRTVCTVITTSTG